MWVGKTVPCVIEQVEPQNNKIIGNIKSAKVVKSARQLVVRPLCVAVKTCPCFQACSHWLLQYQSSASSCQELQPPRGGLYLVC